MAEQNRRAMAILRRRRLEMRIGLSCSTIYDKLNPKSPRYDKTFPKPIRLGSGAVGWLEHEIDEWIDRQIKSSRGSSV